MEVNSEVAFGGAFAMESDIFSLHLADEIVDDGVIGGVDEEVVNLYDDEKVVL